MTTNPLDEIQARHRQEDAWLSGDACRRPSEMHKDRAKLLAAVKAVEAVHVPNSDGDCSGCRDNCLYCEGDHDWPCPTITTIREALG
ncbi:hypothetical protein [Arthrobacter sp. PAMC 25486]|uniref:hypothetical protein n=1 Tax=Arthrobacter sp. PAMC 25486 TaxID=1494608 RepID=UPI00056EE2FB|nr:hypothetical protein [Arthrobacter sp. PAMC 25486]